MKIFRWKITICLVPILLSLIVVSLAYHNYTQGRGCVNCHTEVHGTNNPQIGGPNPQFLLR